MRRIAILPLIVFSMTLLLAPNNWPKRAGLDFWNLRSSVDHLNNEQSRTKRLDFEIEQAAIRREVVERITIDLCDHRITLDEAVELILPVIKSEPVWYTQFQYECKVQGVSTANDRDLATYFAYANVQALANTAKSLGDESRAAAIAKRLAQLKTEIREQKNLPIPLFLETGQCESGGSD